jgi:hypothetical protein
MTGDAGTRCGNHRIPLICVFNNWMCLTGALSALGRKPAEIGFVDTWIFNSSKTFLISPPV